ncbi:Uncharacterized protein APZ42_033746 [Daphnia magna]|uniref:Uncharacterized protein n=1 Tax=Daphnia magna TaxID=35525 RepID=A0A164KU99_9CRUS|nr:Uncharacterized protein APZ42_033746 [Daphnia magna]
MPSQNGGFRVTECVCIQLFVTYISLWLLSRALHNDMALAQAFVKGSSHQKHHTLGIQRKQDGGDASTTLASRSLLDILLTHGTHRTERQASRPSARLVTMGTIPHIETFFSTVIKTTNLQHKRLRN